MTGNRKSKILNSFRLLTMICGGYDVGRKCHGDEKIPIFADSVGDMTGK